MEDQSKYKTKDAELDLEILLGILKKPIETRFLAKALKLSAGDLRKWLCAMGVLTWTYGQGYEIHETRSEWGFNKQKFNPKTQKYEYFIFWKIRGRLEIHKMYRRWLADGNHARDIQQFKR